MLHILKVNGGYMVIILNASLRDMFSLKQHEYNPYTVGFWTVQKVFNTGQWKKAGNYKYFPFISR